jgi:hypothetical protein
MLAVHSSYYRTVLRELGYLTVWPPSSRMAVGDVGRFRGTRFVLLGRTHDMGLDLAPAITVESVSSSDLQISGPGVALRKEDGVLVVELNRAKSIYVEARGCRIHRIRDPMALADWILRQYERGKWAKPWVVVTEVVHADSLAMIVAVGPKAIVKLRALEGEDATPNISSIAGRDYEIQSISRALVDLGRGGSGSTPFFRVMGIGRRSGQEGVWISEVGYDRRILRATQNAVLALSLPLRAPEPNTTPPQPSITAQDERPTPGSEAWGQMNQRRWELIRKKNRDGLSESERSEFDSVQRLSQAALERTHPRPSHDLQTLNRLLSSDELEAPGADRGGAT